MKSRRSVRQTARRTEDGRRGGPASGESPSRAGPWASTRILLASLVLIVLSVVVYAPVGRFGFVWDDADYVTDNAHVAQGLTWEGTRWAFTSADEADPLTWLSHMLDVQFFGMDAGPQHVTNLILHILNALLLFGVFYKMTGAWGRSLFVAGLFAAHPQHVESVAWITERKDVLSTLFWLLTMWAYAAYARQPAWKRYWPVLVFFVLGLMAKPMLVTLPFVLLLMDFWPLGRTEPKARLVAEKLPLFALAAVSCALTIAAQRHGGALAGLEKVPLGVRLTNAPVAYVAYIVQMAWPVRLAAAYPLAASMQVVKACLGLLALAGVSLYAIWAGRRHGYLPVGWLWYLGTLVPVIGLLQAGGQGMADRYMYVPSIGLFVIVAWGAAELAARWRYRMAALPWAAACVLLTSTALARNQVRYWSDSFSLWQHALNVTEDNWVAENNLGGALLKQGKAAEAAPYFTEALRINPYSAEAQANLGMALMGQGKLDEAAQRFGAAVRADPGYAQARDGLGNALSGLGKLDDAVAQYREALRLRPDFAEAHNDLGVAFGRQAKLDEAIREFEEALRIMPGYKDATDNLKLARNMQGKGGQ